MEINKPQNQGIKSSHIHKPIYKNKFIEMSLEKPHEKHTNKSLK
jgi:hypothetical protein